MQFDKKYGFRDLSEKITLQNFQPNKCKSCLLENLSGFSRCKQFTFFYFRGRKSLSIEIHEKFPLESLENI